MLVRVTEVDGLGDVRVVEAARRLRLALESFDRLRTRGDLSLQDLYGYPATDEDVLGLVHLAHARSSGGLDR